MKRIQIPEPRPIVNMEGVTMKDPDGSPAMATMGRLMGDRLRDAKWGAGYQGMVQSSEIRQLFEAAEKAEVPHFDVPDGHHAALLEVINNPSPPSPHHPSIFIDPMIAMNFVEFMRAIVEAKTINPLKDAEKAKALPPPDWESES